MLTSILMATAGGTILGLGAALFLAANGRIAGISGIFAGLLRPQPGDVAWRVTFVVGMLAAGLIGFLLLPGQIVPPAGHSLMTVGIAGLLVGFGVRMGNGCTSGHGVCGLPRLSPRSWVATATFMATGAITATLFGLFAGGAG